LNKEFFRTWQFIRPPRELGGDRNDVSAFMYTARCAFICGAYGSTCRTKAEKTSKSRLNATGGHRFSGVIFQAILSILLARKYYAYRESFGVKNSIVVFGALTDSTFIVSNYKKRHV
jgi:hypothetical protein